ncbi:MAG: hypothetical protein QM790_09700 [Nibricoccus sp.]
MKITNSATISALSITALALTLSSIATLQFSPEIFFGTYAIAGLLCIAATDYSPRLSRSTKFGYRSRPNWIRLSLHGNRRANLIARKAA